MDGGSLDSRVVQVPVAVCQPRLGECIEIEEIGPLRGTPENLSVDDLVDVEEGEVSECDEDGCVASAAPGRGGLTQGNPRLRQGIGLPIISDPEEQP
jgi:hypothetical protein